MRRAALSLVCFLCGCFGYSGVCDLDNCPPPADTCEGVCVPFVGGGWSPVLVPASSTRAHCPEAAPFEAMSSTTITACGVREAPGTCGDQAFACLPEDPAWTACVVRDGAHDCPSPYPLAIDVPDATVSLCCPRDTPPA